MSLRVLIIDNEAKSRATEVLDFASKPENIYRPGPKVKAPGDNPNYVMNIGDFRVVFSLTESQIDQMIYRHLSISVPDRNRFPNPVVVNEVIQLFGFTGGLDACMVDANQREGCIVVAQALRPILS